MDPRPIAQELRAIQIFSDLDEAHLAWLAEHARAVALGPGEALFHEGSPANVMFAVLDGEIRSKREHGKPDGRLFVRRAGEVGGVLPFSRITHFPVTARATVDTRLACFPSDVFPELFARIPALEARLAASMADRVREAAQYDQQREKLISLGRLSAGLAHELNNPSAAIVRTASELGRSLDDLSRIGWALLERASGGAAFRALADLRDRATAQGESTDALARSDAEAALETWLDGAGVANAWVAAETFLAVGVTAADLEAAARDVPDALLLPALGALEADLASRQRLRELAEASRRISDLVSAVKAYSHMDRAPTASDVDLHAGIRSTLAVLAHAVRSKAITVVEAFDPGLTSVPGNPGELNQVWTNLLDNAIDALASGGTITVRTATSDAEAIVQVIDDGSGVPDDIASRIFEPFFTTKGVGEGTGLGLDVVRRIVQAHQGNVTMESRPGRTLFEVRLPRRRSV